MSEWRKWVTVFFILMAVAGVALVMAGLSYGTPVLILGFAGFAISGWPVWKMMFFPRTK